MPRTKTVNYIVYKFEELSEAAQNEALEQIGTGIMESYDPDNLTENFKLILEEWGFPTDKIEWSLSHSQGDGVAFYGSVDIQKFAEKAEYKGKLPLEDMWAYINRNSWGTHYSHWNTMTVDIECDYEFDLDEFTELLRDKVVAVSRNLESIGYAEFDWQTSEERIKELIELNEWEFTEHGRIA